MSITTIRIDLCVGRLEVEEYGAVFNARNASEAKQFLIDDLKGDPFTWGKRLVEIVGREGVEYKVNEVTQE